MNPVDEHKLNDILLEYFTNKIDDGVSIQFEIEFQITPMLEDYRFLIEKIESISILKFFPYFEFEKILIGKVSIDTISFIPILKFNVYLKFNKIDATIIKLVK